MLESVIQLFDDELITHNRKKLGMFSSKDQKRKKIIELLSEGECLKLTSMEEATAQENVFAVLSKWSELNLQIIKMIKSPISAIREESEVTSFQFEKDRVIVGTTTMYMKRVELSICKVNEHLGLNIWFYTGYDHGYDVVLVFSL